MPSIPFAMQSSDITIADHVQTYADIAYDTYGKGITPSTTIGGDPTPASTDGSPHRPNFVIITQIADAATENEDGDATGTNYVHAFSVEYIDDHTDGTSHADAVTSSHPTGGNGSSTTNPGVMRIRCHAKKAKARVFWG